MVGLSLGRVSTYGGIRLIADPHMVDVVEDWSAVRSPSRAARRLRQGHRQRIRYREVPKPDIIHLPGEGVMVAHPATINKLYARITADMDLPPGGTDRGRRSGTSDRLKTTTALSEGGTTVKNEPHLTTTEGRPFGATWLITAPWAHPVWSQYALALYDLTTPSDPAPNIYLDGATHELLLVALDPARPATSAQSLVEGGQVQSLSPPNHGYQFKAESDAAAVSRLQRIVDEIEARRLSPDTDFQAAWDVMFQDAHSLRR